MLLNIDRFLKLNGVEYEVLYSTPTTAVIKVVNDVIEVREASFQYVSRVSKNKKGAQKIVDTHEVYVNNKKDRRNPFVVLSEIGGVKH